MHYLSVLKFFTFSINNIQSDSREFATVLMFELMLLVLYIFLK